MPAVVMKMLLLIPFASDDVLTVRFEGEEPIEGENEQEVFVNALSRFGIEDAYQASATNKGYLVILDKPHESTKEQVEIDGYYVWVSINTRAKAKVILQIANALKVSVEVTPNVTLSKGVKV